MSFNWNILVFQFDSFVVLFLLLFQIFMPPWLDVKFNSTWWLSVYLCYITLFFIQTEKKSTSFLRDCLIVSKFRL